jgi:endonuclease/exonuclease/phosphatase family metal-dependent hydrolase
MARQSKTCVWSIAVTVTMLLATGSDASAAGPTPLPGTLEAENFDDGGSGIAYGDNSAGNAGGAWRSTDVDIEWSSEGVANVGWISAKEWLNYTVNVTSAGSYVVQLRVASPNGGGSMHVGFNNTSNVWSVVGIPWTGGWQKWTTVTLPVTLGAGVQQLTLSFDSGGFNLNSISVVAAGGSPVVPAPAPPPPPSGGATSVSVLTWNIQINDSSEWHARQAMAMALTAGPRPQVIVIEEAWSNHFNNNIYVDELQRQTGQKWRGVFATHCAAGNWNWNGSWCTSQWSQGVGIFTTFDIVSSDSMLFPFWDCWTSARAGVRAALNVNGTILQVFGTHLQTGGCTNDAQSRYSSISWLKWWASYHSTPQIVAGDFNADPNQIDSTAGMRPQFVDSWALVGSPWGPTAFLPNPSMKLDYLFSDSSGRAYPLSTEVVTWTGTVSDHYPVRTTFLVQ